jgi:glutamate synthase (NADPH/NADH) small chain
MKAYEHSKDRAISGVGQHLAIVGSGFDALDCARLALRLGKKVTLIHSSTDDDLEASRQDKTFAREEGLVIESLSRPLGILSDQSGVVCGLRCVRVDFADHGGEWKLLAVKDSEFTLEVDTVIFSGQYKANNFLAAITEGLKVSKQGLLSVKKDQGKTSFANVYATGSLVKGPMDFISTLADAKKTAKEIGLGFEGKGKKRA